MLFRSEGQVLYSLIRILKPESVLEIGALRGCSTTHMATALSINQKGKLVSVDLTEDAGDMMPKHLRDIVTSVQMDGIEYLSGVEDESLDMVFEDSSHGEDQCASIAALCKTKLMPGGILVMHDAAHDIAILGDGNKVNSDVGATVRAGLTRALGDEYRVYISEPSDCGFAVYERPTKQSFNALMIEHDKAIQRHIQDKAHTIAESLTNATQLIEKPKREMTTADGEHLEIVDAPPVETLPEKKKRGRKPKNAV